MLTVLLSSVLCGLGRSANDPPSLRAIQLWLYFASRHRDRTNERVQARTPEPMKSFLISKRAIARTKVIPNAHFPSVLFPVLGRTAEKRRWGLLSFLFFSLHYPSSSFHAFVTATFYFLVHFILSACSPCAKVSRRLFLSLFWSLSKLKSRFRQNASNVSLIFIQSESKWEKIHGKRSKVFSSYRDDCSGL